MKKLFLLLAAITLSVLVPVSVASATGSPASGAGWYNVIDIPEPPEELLVVKSQFQFNQNFVQCKIGEAIMPAVNPFGLPEDTVFQMFMLSTSIDPVVIVSNQVTITGRMDSTTVLHFPDGSQVRISENVPFTAVGVDNATPGAGSDTFALTITYTDAGGQKDIFGPNPTFGGTLEAGNAQTIKSI